jgi:hypothetical protein
MAVRVHRVTSRIGVTELDDLTADDLQKLCDLRMPEDVDLDFKAEDGYTPKGNEGYDELAKDVTGLTNARGGLIIIGIGEDAQGCAESLHSAPVSDKKIGQFTSALRARIVPWLPDFFIKTVETVPGSGEGYMLIAVPASPMAPHPVRVSTRPQYSYARRVGRTTAWLEESEIAARYRDRFRQAEDHRAQVVKVLEAGAEWASHTARANLDRIYLDLAIVPSGPAERRVDKAHIDAVTAFFAEHSKPGASPRPAFQLGGQPPAVLRGRLRLEPYSAPTAGEAYADGRIYLRTEVSWSTQQHGDKVVAVLNLLDLEYWLLVQLQAAVKYAEWAGAYGDVDVLAVLNGPTTVVPDTRLSSRAPFLNGPKERTDTEPVHTTSTLDALASDPVQLVACARRLATEFLADFGYVETKLLTPDGRILSSRLDEQARVQVEAWMREVGLPVEN